MAKGTNCRIPGCKMSFVDELQAVMHAANTWHCVICGFSDGKELTKENMNEACPFCVTGINRLDYYKVDFVRKCYMLFRKGKIERFVTRENNKWVAYG